MGKTLNPDYRAALDFLYSFVDYERELKWKYDKRHFNLKWIRDFLEVLGNPHEHGWFVHVAGTNGKGSVAAMIANTLTRAGLRTGLYTSPHLITFCERIRVDGYMMTPGEVTAGVGRMQEAQEYFQGLSFFDVWTALAFDYFAHMSVDASVIEVGMGGRLDTTNVITPAVSIITSVSMDHRGKLGEILEEIACEKAGIIKPGVPVVSAPQESGVLRVLEKRAKEVGTTLTVVGRDVSYKKVNSGISYSGLIWVLDEVNVPLNGSMQLENAAVALTALETLDSGGYPLDSFTACKGIETVQWPGRLQVVASNPEIIVDGACNTGAMSLVGEFLSTRRTRDKTVAVLGMCRDKEVTQVLDVLGNAASRFVVTQVDNPRAMKADELGKRVPENVVVAVEPDLKQAMEKAVSMAGTDGLVIATGSLYLVGEVLKLYGIKKIEKI